MKVVCLTPHPHLVDRHVARQVTALPRHDGGLNMVVADALDRIGQDSIANEEATKQQKTRQGLKDRRL